VNQRVLLLAIFWAAPVQNFVSAVLGSSVRERDVFGQYVWVEKGDYSRWVEYLVFSVVLLCLVIWVFQSKGKKRNPLGRFKTHEVFLGFAILTSVLVNITSWSVQDLLRLTLFLFCCGYFLVEKITLETIAALKVSSVILLISICTFVVARPFYSQGPCRPDKCSPFGMLLNGYFPHENFLALVLLASFPLLSSIQPRRWRYLAQAACGVLILASGARTVYLAIVIFLIIMLPPLKNLARFAPITMLLVSLIVFSTARGYDLSGRGLVYEVLAKSLENNWLFGAGPTALSQAYQNGQIVFLAYHEHGIAPYLLGRFGVLIFFGFALLFIFKSKKPSSTSDFSITLPFVATALTFASETTLQLNISGAFAWAFLVYLGNKSDFLDEAASPYKRSPASPSPGTM